MRIKKCSIMDEGSSEGGFLKHLKKVRVDALRGLFFLKKEQFLIQIQAATAVKKERRQ